MKLIFFILLLMQIASADQVTQLLSKNTSKKAVPLNELIPAIRGLSAKHGIDPVLVTRIILVESRGVEAIVNVKTQDYGLMQINIKTARAMGLKKACLLNWRCNLEAGIKHLKTIKKHQPCAYNLGAVGSKKYKKACETYHFKLALFN